MNDQTDPIHLLGSLGHALAPDRPSCACHRVADRLCPDAPPARPVTAPVSGALSPASLARLIDHTLLKPEATPAQLRRLCAEARSHAFGAVCVNPAWVRLCAEELAGSQSVVAAVAGFPLGASLPELKAAEASRALRDGAGEIDMVLNVGALKAAEHRLVESDVRVVVEACRERGGLLKVIIEAALLTDEEKVTACAIAKLAGADFVKTSTGFGPGGASEPDVALMRRTVGPGVGVKAAGGIRDWPTARRMIAAGANRIGTSSGVKILTEASEDR